MPDNSAERSSSRRTLADQFAELCKDNDAPPDVFQFLEGHPHASLREQVQVLQADQSHRWSSGTGRLVEEYLARCPELAADEPSKLELIAAEYEQRTAHGERIDLDVYLQRFPEMGDSLQETLSARSEETVRSSGPTISETVEVRVPGVTETVDVPPPEPKSGTPRPPRSQSASGDSPEAQSAGHGEAAIEETVQVQVSFDDPAETVAEAGPTDRDAEHRSKQSESRASAGSGAKESVIGHFGDYELLQEIARGGMGIVYKARQVRLNRLVALKMILTGQFADDEEIARFHTEAEAAAQLDHPHIVPIYEVGEHEGRHYFSMGFVEGKSLADKIAEGPVSPREAAGLMRNVAEAVAYAHERKIIHRDLKPANVLLDNNGQPRVTDFGLAKSTETASQLTATGQIMGTPSYMPPEQALGKMDDVGPLADVYSLGAVLYCLLTGRPPFQAASVVDTLRQVVEKEPVSPQQLNPEVDRDLETICLKCLAKEPRNRYASAAELAEELGRFLSGEPIRARPVGATERLWRWCKRKPVVASLLALSVVSLVVGTVVSTSFAIIANRRAENYRQSFQMTRRAIDELYVNISENTLLNQPGMQALRHELLEAALKHYQQLREMPHDDPTLQDDLAQAYYRAGSITEEIGSAAAALPVYRQGLQLQRRLVAEQPGNLDRLEIMADTLNALGGGLSRVQQYGQAYEAFREAIDIRERLVQADPNQVELHRTLANSYMNLGLVEKERGNKDEARKLMERAQSLRREQLQRTDDFDLRRDLAMGAYNLGTLLLYEDDAREPETHFTQAAVAFEQLVEENPRDLNNQYRLAVCYRLLGELKWTAQDWEAVAKYFGQARDQFDTLAQQNPDVPEYRAALAGVWMNLGELERGHERPQAALESFQQALNISEQLVHDFPNVSQYRRDYAVALRTVAAAQWDIGERKLSLENTRASRKHLRALVKQAPDNEEYRFQLQQTESALQGLSNDDSTP